MNIDLVRVYDDLNLRKLQLLQQTDPEQPLGAILKTALDAAIVMDSDGRIVDWNEVASELFGWSRDEAVGSILADLIIPPALRSAHTSGIHHFLATGKAVALGKRIEVSALKRSGIEFPVELSISSYVDRTQLLFLGFIRDITQWKEAAQILERRAHQAKILYEAVSLTSEATTFEDALRVCLRAVQELTGWAIGHVYLRSTSDPGELLPSNIWRHSKDEMFRELREVTARSKFQIGSGLPGRVWQTGEAVWVPDIYSDRNLPRASLMANAAVKSALGFPIKNAGSVIAVVELFTPNGIRTNPDLMLTLRTIGDQVGRVLERRLAEAELKRQTEHQQLLLAELNHRVKNMLAVVSGIASQTARNSQTIEGFTTKFLGRIDALSRAHSMLTAQNWKATSLQTIAEQVFAPYSDWSTKVKMGGAAVSLMPKEALSVSLLLHEMVTNAAKYGALAKEARKNFGALGN